MSSNPKAPAGILRYERRVELVLFEVDGGLQLWQVVAGRESPKRKDKELRGTGAMAVQLE